MGDGATKESWGNRGGWGRGNTVTDDGGRFFAARGAVAVALRRYRYV